MDRSGMANRVGRAVAGACLLLPFVVTGGWAGTTGKVSGRVTEAGRKPLMGVNVAIPGARLGAITDEDGRYVVINVPAGRYELKLGLIGYRATTITDVVVSADQTTTIDATLQVAPVEMEEVVVSAQRPVVDVNLTSTVASVDRKEILNLPVQELQDVVNLQAGVVEGHFRGGRKGEVQYQVDGVTVNNLYDNASTLRLDRSLLEEVQVVSGTFDAEYGQAMSGVVNAVLRRGSEDFRWDAELLGGGFLYPGGDRIQSFEARPGEVQNYQLSVSGPAPVRATTYLASGRYYHFDDWFRATRLFRPNDRSDFENGIYRPTGDGGSVAMAYTREWSGITKLTNRSFQNLEFSYQAVFNRIEGRRNDFLWRYNPDGVTKQTTFSLMHGLDFTHTLGRQSYYTLSARQNYFDYKDRVYDDLRDPRYVEAGPPETVADFAGTQISAAIQGAQQTRFRQETNSLVLKGTYVNQYRRDQQFKAGGEFQWPILRFGAMGYIQQEPDSTGRIVYNFFDSDPPTFPGVLEYRPVLGAAFAQEELEWNDLRVRGGLRFEYFDANARLPRDLKDPANVLNPIADPLRATTAKYSLAPRVGVSYPVTRDAALFFAYGHFYQLPQLGQAFNDADYRVLQTLQAGTANYRVMGNPDIRPERTVQYQFGYKQALSEWTGVELNAFYKDIRDLLGVEFVETYNVASYARLTNVDFGDVVGFTLSFDRRPRGLLSMSMDYTWQLAQGNASDPDETATRAQAGQDPRPRQVPFEWDQRHTLNLQLVLAKPEVFSTSAIIRIASGQPYTPTVTTGFGGGLEENSGRKPAALGVDLRGEKRLRLAGADASLFGRVLNLLDTRYFNGAVYPSTGSPYYSRDVASDRGALADPTRYYGPRRIEIGITLGAGGE